MLFALFGFSGRIGRLQYLLYSMLVSALVIIPTVAIVALTFQGHGLLAIATPMIVGGVLLAVSMAALTAKRLHDLDLSGWHALWLNGLGLVQWIPWLHGSFVGLFCLIFQMLMGLFLMLAPGTSGPNGFDGSGLSAPPRRASGDPIARLNFGER